MRPQLFSIRAGSFLSTVAFAIVLSGSAMAHCDSMDGPVVKDAQRALVDKRLEPVLKWVRAEDEDEIRKAFEMTIAVRNESEKARTVADRYFFETVVRIHRAGEGEGFTGLKPAGSVDPGIAAADKALADGNVDQLADKLAATAIDLEGRRRAVVAKYYDRVKQAVGPRTALRFLQVEHQLLLLIDLQISAALPIAK